MKFQRAKPEQAALKMSIYGPPGAGKTFTALLLAEGLAKRDDKRIAFVDTERGTDFYCQPVQQRKIHAEAFDFDAVYTRSLTAISQAVRSLNPQEYGVIVIDSVTHLWEAAKASWTGEKTKIGTTPLYAWAAIKRPYKELIQLLLNSPFHVFLLGRQGNDFFEDETTGLLKFAGVKMKAENETPYEPHICLRMEAMRDGKKNTQTIPTAFVEKDRTGVLQGKAIPWPSFDNIAKPLLNLLGGVQAQLENEEDAGRHDAEVWAEEERQRRHQSADKRRELIAKMEQCETPEEIDKVGGEITTELKRWMSPQDVAMMRDNFRQRRNKLKHELVAVS